ncbi:response regulator transcription factor [Kovacikia minuta CCNUW1]|uniref:response regulator transcription factor n=1 Tax=Kovacikia minuta TaxID=2931930 RepID=UPI001CCECE91|nr:response regulator transcription factor [Kovacikia minuta]UBF25039.1 response regulator transcription factor [Kovacikia minuta CCNUW1]
MQQRLGSESSLIRVLILARSVVMRAGLEALISSSSELEVVGSFAVAESLAQQMEQLQPDVVLLEWEAASDRTLPLLNPNLDGDAMIRPMDSAPDTNTPSEAFRVSASPALVALVDDWQQATVTEALRLGVRGILPADATATEIVEAIQAAAIGLTVLHPDLVAALLANLPATTAPALPVDPQQALTAREIEVLGMLAEGLGNKAIARRLSISEHTVKFHIGSIFSKLNASSRTEAVILGARQGLILL